MFAISVKNLYIGKLGIDLSMQGQLNGIRIKGSVSLDPTTLVGEVLEPYSFKSCYAPDYGIQGGYWDHLKNRFLINPIGTPTHSLWLTGVPLESDIQTFLLPDVVYQSIYKDNHKKYLTQITLI